MTQHSEEPALDQPVVDGMDTPQAPEQLEPDSTLREVEETTPPSRLKLFFRKALIWLVVIVIAFLAGFLTDHFLRYRPLDAERAALQSQLDDATQTISELHEENDRLTKAFEEANDTIATLQEELEVITANVQYFQVLIDVNNARIKLFMDDSEGAQASLIDTQELLEELLPLIESVDVDLALSLPRRLDLIVSGLERDPETGLIDLELFTKDLLELQPLLFADR